MVTLTAVVIPDELDRLARILLKEGADGLELGPTCIRLLFFLPTVSMGARESWAARGARINNTAVLA